MAGQLSQTEQNLNAVADPGAINREDHLWPDRLMVHLGNTISWLFVVLMLAIVTQVIIRKMGFNQAWLDDAQWWMYGLAMVMAFGYAITTNSHVRVDILHQYYSPQKKARVEVFALGWLLLPFLIFMTDILFHYAAVSWIAKEGSDSPNGLHGVYLLKASLPILFAIIVIGSFSSLIRQFRNIGGPAIHAILLGAFPSIVFLVERTIYYTLWWFIRLTQPDLNVRRITREPIFDHTVWIALALVLAAIALSFLRHAMTKKGAQ